MPKRHAWTGISSAITAGNQAIHDEIANSQVEHWTPRQIKAAEKRGYFDKLSAKCQRNTRLYLLAELCGDEEEE